MDRLGFERPTDVPHATEYVDEMVAMIGELVEIGRAYITDDGVYLSVETVEDYGLLAHQSLDEMLAGGGEREVFGADQQAPPGRLRAVEAGQAGRAVVAVAVGRGPARLAQRVRRDEPRPARRGLRPALRWEDLRFPHHENERAQAVALGKRFANHWMHHAFVVDREGEKMSK